MHDMNPREQTLRRVFFGAMFVAGGFASAMLPPERVFPAVRAYLHFADPVGTSAPIGSLGRTPPRDTLPHDPAVEAGRVTYSAGAAR
jgi:hypothetical protein